MFSPLTTSLWLAPELFQTLILCEIHSLVPVPVVDVPPLFLNICVFSPFIPWSEPHFRTLVPVFFLNFLSERTPVLAIHAAV